MSALSLRSSTLDKALHGWVEGTIPPVTITGVSLDSRLVEKGDLYLAVGGASTHGIHFADAAVTAGAVAVATSPEAFVENESLISLLRERDIPVLAIEGIAEHVGAIASRFYGEPDKLMTLIAVTGTDGKTSVCRFIAQALSAANQRCGYIGTIGWGMGDSLLTSQLTTPDAVSVRRMLANMHDQGAKFVALEASSHGLAERRLDGLSLDMAVFTNLGRDHLDYHGSMEAYQQAKSRLFTWPGLSAIVVNGCDAMGQKLLSSAAGLKCYAFYADVSLAELTVIEKHNALSEACQPVVVAALSQEIHADDTGLEFVLRDAEQSGKVHSNLLGKFNIDNLLACYGSLRACGIAANEARHCLSKVSPVEGRMERFGGKDQPTVVVDFSHTPQALSVAIDAVRLHCRGKLWVVFGCGGDRDSGKRAPMARAAEAADFIVLTDDNPRTESSAEIISAIMAGFTDSSRVKVICDRAAAIRYAVFHAQDDDLILIAGKGHEQYQIVGNERLPFSDRAVALSALEEAS